MKTLTNTYNFGVALKVLPEKGNLAWEYNPFFNYRLDHDMIFYKNRLMEYTEFAEEIGLEAPQKVDKPEDLSEGYTDEDKKNYDELLKLYNIYQTYLKDKNKGFQELIASKNNWDGLIPKSETPPIPYLKGLLVDFETDLLNFDLNNPVNIIPLWSYDNSVNLIINDGKNPPRLINSRFSATERNKYQVCNRKGNDDSNIYDLGEQFDIDTSLYKKINTIPKLEFLGLDYGGNLSIGNYHFYFKYVDADGNESDIFAESGLISIFIGNTADSIHSGFRNENSNKLVKFLIKNTDSGYSKLSVYYTKATSDIYENMVVSAYKINLKFLLSKTNNTLITISGFEPVDEIPITDINALYQIYGSAETLATALNMLFLANLDRPKVEHEDLQDCALRFLPYLDTSEKYDVDKLGVNYSGSILNTYYDPKYIYNKVGYWDDEIYRFGIVFIKSDGTLTEAFNVRGGKLKEGYEYSNISLFTEENGELIRNYISYDELYYNIISSQSALEGTELENARGVVHIDCPDFKTVIGIKFKVDKEVIDYLQSKYMIKGFFFVRLKRIPTTLCQAYTIGIDKESHTPVLPLGGKFLTESFISKYDKNDKKNSKLLTHNIEDRIRELKPDEVKIQGAICPEYDVNSPYLNSLFSASELVCRNCKESKNLNRNNRHFYPEFNFKKESKYTKIKVIGVEDNTKLVAINDDMFSARAGEAEEAFRFEYIGHSLKQTEADNLLRGSYGPYLGITGYADTGDSNLAKSGHLIDIKIPGYDPALMLDYFTIRYSDNSSFYAISDRFVIKEIDTFTNLIKDEDDLNKETYELKNPLYRGDCYICLFTHRINRNFLDPSAPTNDEIIDPDCWRENYKVTDLVLKVENFDKINLGDVNAVMLGMYVTLVVRSSINLNIRALNDSIPDEIALIGHPRGFYPFSPMTTRGSYKHPEALCYNKGFEKSVSEKTNIPVPDIPWVKNEFSNRIAYSNIQIKDAFYNGWRTFKGGHYNDYPKTYGSITKLVELNGNLLCVFEHGVCLIPINERAVAGEGSGGNVFINTAKVLPDNPIVISDSFGSLWRESIIKTPLGVYGVDTVGKKIWFTDGKKEFKCISDFAVQEFLNQNISLTERELKPILGIRNVKTHYNAFKGDVMFTFYDNLHGFEEKVWNLCYNERINKWVTFYSWIPSYSENIYNQYFSFDRNTSKWIAKLGISNSNNDFADGITLSNNVIPNDAKADDKIGELSLKNRILPEGEVKIIYRIEHDNFGNWRNFDIVTEKDGNDEEHHYLVLKKDAINLCSELYVRGEKEEDLITDPGLNNESWVNHVKKGLYKVYKDARGRKKMLENPYNIERIVSLLNIKADIEVTFKNLIPSLEEAHLQNFLNGVTVDGGYYESVIAVIPEYNKLFLTTDFWKHGLSGIIDISDKINPTYWYGKQHPFEFEFIVNDNAAYHKIFENLLIISNNVKPESFHYEIVGDSYEFANDKKNMYIRQEATKHLYLYNGMNVMYDHDYSNLNEKLNDKSTLFPLYYSRLDTFNEIEDTYHLKDGVNTKDFSQLSGAEIVRYKTLDEYRIWNHAKAIDLTENERMRSNMHYKEDKWYVLINPINIIQYNEEPWRYNKIPIELGQSPIPDLLYELEEIIKPIKNDVVTWKWEKSDNKEVKLKDKYMKVRIRYKGDDLSIIAAINTIYSLSFS